MLFTWVDWLNYCFVMGLWLISGFVFTLVNVAFDLFDVVFAWLAFLL